MVVRLGAAICGAAVILACSSAATTLSEFAVVHSYAAFRAANDRSIQRNPPSKGPAIIGVASTYNPYRPGYRSGGKKTASGEPYDPSAWTAAIRTDLRERFDGVRYGKSYRMHTLWFKAPISTQSSK
jgi:rare lipoprotein A